MYRLSRHSISVCSERQTRQTASKRKPNIGLCCHLKRQGRVGKCIATIAVERFLEIDISTRWYWWAAAARGLLSLAYIYVPLWSQIWAINPTRSLTDVKLYNPSNIYYHSSLCWFAACRHSFSEELVRGRRRCHQFLCAHSFHNHAINRIPTSFFILAPWCVAIAEQIYTNDQERQSL